MHQPYLPPLDLLVLLGFAPGPEDGWRYELDEQGDNGYLQLTAHQSTGILVLSDNYQLEEPTGKTARVKTVFFWGLLPSLPALLDLLVENGWQYDAKFDLNDEEFLLHLYNLGYLSAEDLNGH